MGSQCVLASASIYNYRYILGSETRSIFSFRMKVAFLLVTLLLALVHDTSSLQKKYQDADTDGINDAEDDDDDNDGIEDDEDDDDDGDGIDDDDEDDDGDGLSNEDDDDDDDDGIDDDEDDDDDGDGKDDL